MNNLYYISRIFPKIRNVFYRYYNRVFFALLGIEYGCNMKVYDKIYIGGKGSIKIGDNFEFTSGGNVNPICRNIRGSIYAGLKKTRIEIGDNVGISSACLWAQDSITIGNNVNIGGDCLIMDNDAHPHDHMKRRNSYLKQVGVETYLNDIPSAPIVIEDDVWIGARCQILKGVHIGARTIIAAGSIVTKDIPADVLAGGIPCRIIRDLA